MEQRRLVWTGLFFVLACALVFPASSLATGVPISGFFPLVGIGLTNEFDNDLNFYSDPSAQPGGIMLGAGGVAHYDLALMDTGAAFSLLSAQSDSGFNLSGPYPNEPDGFRGTETIDIGGATGTVTAQIDDPLGLYAGGVQGRTSASPFTMGASSLVGQTNTSLITAPSTSTLPNIVGLSFSSQYATSVRADLPQIFQLNGRTVRAPQISFSSLGSGGQGLVRRAPLSLNPGTSFSTPPAWFPNFANFDLDKPEENPSAPTVLQGGLFLNVSANNHGQSVSNSQFLFDTGADTTVVSQLTATQLGFDPVLDKPDFTVSVLGSGGTVQNVPGFYAEQLTVSAIGGNVTLTHVPIIVLDVTDPGNPGNVVPGIIGTNIFVGRNLVIDPKPSNGGGGVGPSLYIGDSVTTQFNWSSSAASGTFATGGNWSGSTAPATLGIANVRHVSGGNQTAVVAANTTVWELNVSGTDGKKMAAEINSGVTFTTYSGSNIEGDGVIQLDSGTLDTQYLEITAGGILRGSGTILTGSGPIPGQVENRSGTISPGATSPGTGVGAISIDGNLAEASDATFAVDLGGTSAGQFDQITLTGSATLAGGLQVSLANLGGGLFTPHVGNSFTIVSATDGLSGTFDSLTAPLGYNWYLSYGANSVQLIIGVPGDYNHDGVVNTADYVVWRNTKNSTTNLTADGNGNGVIDQGDYDFWRSHFGATSGAGAGGAAAVPEPTTLSLACLAALIICGWRRSRS